ncbi:MAG: GGDEF domain-containing protein [Clostridia bacterium]|nr:GGDEF domain-containing protein [Clostridia bacterium]
MMKKGDCVMKRPRFFLWLCLALYLSLAAALPALTETIDPGLTSEERAYLADNPVIRLLVVDGAAPIVTLTEDGDYAGIAKSVTNRIGQILGVEFVMSLTARSSRELAAMVQSGDADVVMIPKIYAQNLFPDVPLTDPFLTAHTILFYHKEVNPNDLDGRKCAVVVGSGIPQGVAEEDVIYCETRLESVQLVENGIADFGYGNEFSLAYYVGYYEFKNISTVPIRTDTRQYLYGIVNGEPLLLSAINKAIAIIDAQQMQSIILENSVLPEQPITLSDIIESFAIQISTILAIFVLCVTVIALYIFRTNRRLKFQNLLMVTTAEVSGDLLFNYNVNTGQLMLSKQFRDEFGINPRSSYSKSDLSGLIDIDGVIGRGLAIDEVSLPDGRYYKAIYAYIRTKEHDPIYLIGKLIDISAERARLEALTDKAKRDGLTNLLNAAECKRMSQDNLSALPAGRRDALIILDIDDFKSINDNYGHYTGDQVLIKAAGILSSCFRSGDVVGRLGGDEFMVYLKDVDGDALEKKCERLVEEMNFPIMETSARISISLGAYLISAPQSFSQAYKRADEALYRSKREGKNRFVIVE